MSSMSFCFDDLIHDLFSQLNGSATVMDDIADNIGFKIAYDAYRTWQNINVEEARLAGLEEYTPNQMFWISSAQYFCSKYPEFDEDHSTDEYRVIGSLSNRPEFADDFKCRFGSRMNPVHKCSLISKLRWVKDFV